MISIAGPAEVKGFYQKIRDILHPVLITFFIAAPWIQINDQPMLLFDVFNRHFVFFGSTFYAHEAPLLFFLIILAVLAIFLVTALFGRLWCGWSCPQTVFLNAVFNRVERWILGTYSQRMVFYKSQDSLKKKIKIFSLYFIYMILCWFLSHVLVAYFLGSKTVTNFILEGPSAHLNTFITCSIVTAALFFNFAFFREKLCLYVCPYGRFQNILIDQNSLVVSYNQIRGEPRSKMSTYTTDKGDCVDCRRCVNVCPAKIDIRNGFQLECISCGQCIDACNSVMEKLNRPQSLILYETGNQKPVTFKRFRLGLYILLIALFSSGLAWSLHQRAEVEISISRAHLIPFSYRIEGDKKVLQNQIQLHIKNQTQKPMPISLSLGSQNQLDGYKLSSPAVRIVLDPGQDLKTNAFIEVPYEKFISDRNEIVITLQSKGLELHRSLKFIRQE